MLLFPYRCTAKFFSLSSKNITDPLDRNHLLDTTGAFAEKMLFVFKKGLWLNYILRLDWFDHALG